MTDSWLTDVILQMSGRLCPMHDTFWKHGSKMNCGPELMPVFLKTDTHTPANNVLMNLSWDPHTLTPIGIHSKTQLGV